MVMTLAYPCA